MPQGTLDMLILRTLLFGPAHGHRIAEHIQRTTDHLLQVEHGSLYPALHRQQFLAEESEWKKLTGAVARIMWPAAEN